MLLKVKRMSKVDYQNKVLILKQCMYFKREHAVKASYCHETIQQARVWFRRRLQTLHGPLFNDGGHLAVLCV